MDPNLVFQSQQDFFRSQKTKNIAFRKSNLLKLKRILQSHEEQMCEAIFKDFGKSKFDTFASELSIIYAEIDYFLKHLSKLAKPERVKTNLANQPGRSYIFSEPLGTVLVMGAWNYPYMITLVPMVCAIAAGNTCMIKPSELPENTMRVMAEMIKNNFPSDFLFVVQGGIPETTEILKFPYDKIFFTGSPKVGKIVYEAAAKNLTPVTLELGGKSPAIVTKTADLKVAARRIVWGKFLNAGQTCIAPDYLLVDTEIKDQLLELMKERLEYKPYEDGSDHYVSIINQRNFDRLLGLIDKEKIYHGGKQNERTRYIEPTILTNISWEDTVMQDEIFGPILPVLTYSDFDQALEKLLHFEKPLAAYLFSNTKSQKDKFLRNFSFGGGCINDTLMHIANQHLPFGGIGNSGMGSYHGAFGFDAFSHKKAVIKKSNWLEPDIKYPPYSETKAKWIKRLL